MTYQEFLAHLQKTNPQGAQKLIAYHVKTGQLFDEKENVLNIKAANKVLVANPMRTLELWDQTDLLFLREPNLSSEVLLLGCGNAPVHLVETETDEKAPQGVKDLYAQFLKSHALIHAHEGAITVDITFIQNPTICADIHNPKLYDFFIVRQKKFKHIIAEGLKPCTDNNRTTSSLLTYWQNTYDLLADDGIYHVQEDPYSVVEIAITKQFIDENILTPLKNKKRKQTIFSSSTDVGDLSAIPNVYRGEAALAEINRITQVAKITIPDTFINLISGYLKGDKFATEQLKTNLFIDEEGKNLLLSEWLFDSHSIQKLCAGLNQNKNTQILHRLKIVNCGLKAEDIILICQTASQMACLDSLAIGCNFFNRASFEAILKLIDTKKQQLQELDLSCYSFHLLQDNMVQLFREFLPQLTAACDAYGIELFCQVKDSLYIKESADFPGRNLLLQFMEETSVEDSDENWDELWENNSYDGEGESVQSKTLPKRRKPNEEEQMPQSHSAPMN